MPNSGRQKKSSAVPVVSRKVRRTPYEVLLDLKSKRDALVQRSEAKLAKLDEKIHHLEEKFQRKIALEELKATKSPDELVLELQEVKRRQTLLKQALKLTSK